MIKYKIIALMLLLVQSLFNIANSQNRYLNFDGNNDYVQVNINTSLNYSGDFTLELKFKRERTGIREDLLTKKDLKSSSPSENDVAVFLTNDNKINVLLRETVVNELILSSQTSIDTKTWVHVACVKQSNSVLLYVNGKLEDSGTINTDLSSSGPLRIGSNRAETLDPDAAATQPFDGNIDEVRIWNLGRSSTEITNNLNTELTGNEPGIVAYYNFNQGIPCSDNLQVNTLVDASLNNNTGFLTNFDLTGKLNNPCESNWNGTLPPPVDPEVVIPSNLIIPNIITPNGDGKNDAFVIASLELNANNPIKIYNRWGKLVYQSEAYQNNWFAGDLPSGSYYYVLQHLQTNKLYKGWVEVVR